VWERREIGYSVGGLHSCRVPAGRAGLSARKAGICAAPDESGRIDALHVLRGDDRDVSPRCSCFGLVLRTTLPLPDYR
jgi:hypothetical protein